VEALLQRAIETARAGHKEQARDLLISILREDPRNVLAWKWFVTVAQSPDEARQALQNILRLDPSDAWARNAFAELESRSRQQPRQRERQAGVAQQQPQRRGRGAPRALVVVLGVVLVSVCVVGVGSIALLNSEVGLSTVPLAAEVPSSTPMPVTVADIVVNPPTLPPSWTPSAAPTLPTLTQAATLTPTTPPPSSVTPLPTPALIDVPVESDIDHVPLDMPIDTSNPVTESQTVQYYPVTGSNAVEINLSILANGPKGGGQNAIAQIQYSTSLQYSMRQTANSCAPEEAVAHLTMIFTYPEYNPPPDVSQEMLDQWDSFMVRVVEHEETHAEIARQCALDMVNSFYSLQPTSTCATLQDNLEVMQASIDADCDAQQAAFDAQEGGDSFP